MVLPLALCTGLINDGSYRILFFFLLLPFALSVQLSDLWGPFFLAQCVENAALINRSINFDLTAGHSNVVVVTMARLLWDPGGMRQWDPGVAKDGINCSLHFDLIDGSFYFDLPPSHSNFFVVTMRCPLTHPTERLRRQWDPGMRPT